MNLGAFFKAKTGPLPNWVWAGVAVLGLGVGIFIVKRQQQSSTADSTPVDPNASADLSSTAGYDPSQSNGHEVIIVPIGDYQTQNQIPDNSQRTRPSTGSGGTHTIPTKTFITIRQRYSINIASVMDYDKLSPNGVPVRPVPGSSSEVRKQAFGSQVETTGNAVSGTSNVKESGQGSTSWYPVSGGYISGLDVVGTSQKTATTPSNGTVQQNTSNGSTNNVNSSTTRTVNK